MKQTAQEESKSLKTFYLYVLLVITVVIIALLSKAFLIFQQSKFDGTHDFIIAVTEQNKVKEIISFQPQITSATELVIEDTNISFQSLAKEYGIHPDGYIQVNTNSVIAEDVTAFMWASLGHTADWQSNLTIFDKLRLLLFAKSVAANNKSVDEISLINQTQQNETTLTNALTDQEIADENISIQIVNATDITGFGQRLSRVLTNLGANIVAVTTAQNIQKDSTIQYYGSNSYTVNRLDKLLGIKATKLNSQGIANIVITIGLDKSNTTQF